MDKQKTLDRRRQRRIDNKEKATVVMLELVLETGEMPDVEEIIKRAGISRRSFFRYFQSESIRIQELNRLMIRQVSSRFQAPYPDPSRTLGETLRLFVDVKTQVDEYRMPLRKLAERTMRTTPQVKEYYEERRIHWSKQIEELFSPHLEGRRDKPTLLQCIHFNTSWRVWDTLRNDFEMGIEASRRFIRRQILAVLGMDEPGQVL